MKIDFIPTEFDQVEVIKQVDGTYDFYLHNTKTKHSISLLKNYVTLDIYKDMSAFTIDVETI